jgi:hypothetical protein
MDASQEEATAMSDACLWSMKAWLGELKATEEEVEVAVQKHKVPNEEKKVEWWVTGGPLWGPVSGCKAPPKAAETDPGRLDAARGRAVPAPSKGHGKEPRKV